MATESIGTLSLSLEAQTKNFQTALGEARRHVKITAEDMAKLESMDMKKATASLKEVTQAYKEAERSSRVGLGGKESLSKIASSFGSIGSRFGADLQPAVQGVNAALNLTDTAFKTIGESVGVAGLSFKAFGKAIWASVSPLLAVAAGIAAILALTSSIKKLVDSTPPDKKEALLSQKAREVRENINKATAEFNKYSKENTSGGTQLPMVSPIEGNVTQTQLKEMRAKATEVTSTGAGERWKPIIDKGLEDLNAIQKSMVEGADESTNSFLVGLKDTLLQFGDDIKTAVTDGVTVLREKISGPDAWATLNEENKDKFIGVSKDLMVKEKTFAELEHERLSDAAKLAKKTLQEQQDFAYNKIRINAQILKVLLDVEKNEKLALNKRIENAAHLAVAPYIAEMERPVAGPPENFDQLRDYLVDKAPKLIQGAVGVFIDSFAESAPKVKGLIDAGLQGFKDGGIWGGLIAMGAKLLSSTKGIQAIWAQLEGVVTYFVEQLDYVLSSIWKALIPVVQWFLGMIDSISGAVGGRSDRQENFVNNLNRASQKANEAGNVFEALIGKVSEFTGVLNAPSGFKLTLSRLEAIYAGGGGPQAHAPLTGYTPPPMTPGTAWGGAGSGGNVINISEINVNGASNIDAIIDDAQRKMASKLAAATSAGASPNVAPTAPVATPLASHTSVKRSIGSLKDGG